MAIPPLVLQTAGSLVAILALAGLAWLLKLGGTALLNNEDAVRRAAGEIEDGFVPATFAVSEDGASALASGADGRIMVIRQHGNRFAGRILTAAAGAVLEDNRLVVDCGEAGFGTAFLTVPDAQAWANAINRVNERSHA